MPTGTFEERRRRRRHVLLDRRVPLLPGPPRRRRRRGLPGRPSCPTSRSAGSTPPASSSAKGKTFRWRGRYSKDLEQPRDARHAAQRLRGLPPEDPRRVQEHALRAARQHPPGAPARGARAGRQAEARRRRHDELLDHRRAQAPRRGAEEDRPPRHQRRRGARAHRASTTS